MRHAALRILLVIFAAASLPLVVGGQSPAAALFHEALMLERADGKLADAIFRYERVVAEFPKDAEIAPQALYRLAVAYEKKADPRAAVMFSRLVADFPTAKPYAADARTRLAAMRSATDGPFSVRKLHVPWNPYLRFSPDGTKATYLCSKNKGTSYCLRDVTRDSQEERILFEIPAKAFLYSFLWSPDSKQLALSVVTAPLVDSDKAAAGDLGPMALGELRVVALATGSIQTIAPSGQALAWSPGGDRLAAYIGASESTAEIHVLTIATGANQTLATDQAGGKPSGAAWSPDGQRLAFRVTNERKVDEFRVATIATGESRVLAVPDPPAGWRTRVDTGYMGGGGWTTGNEIVFLEIDASQSEFNVFLVSALGGRPIKACSERKGVSSCGPIAPDGSSHVKRDIKSTRYMLVDLAAQTEHPLTTSSGSEDFGNSSRDGRLFSYVSNRDGKWGIYVVPIGVQPVANPVLVASLDTKPLAVPVNRWTRDGTLIVGLASQFSDIYRVGMDPKTGRSTGLIERLTHEAPVNDNPVPSPTGDQIVYRQLSLAGGVSIAVMKPVGSGERPVLTAREERPFLSWPFSPLTWRSPDEILFNADATISYNSNRPVQISSLNIKTGAVAPAAHGGLPSSGGTSWWEYIRSSNEILYQTSASPDAKLGDGAPGMFRLRSLADGADRLVGKIENQDNLFGFRASPDGMHVAYTVVKNPAALRGGYCPCELRLLSMDGTPEKVLLKPTVPAIPVAWSPNGEFLLYTNAIGAKRILNLATAENWPLLESGAAPGGTWGNGNWSSDGGSILMSRGDTRYEIHAWSGLTYDAIVKLTKPRGK